jgi:hypothetical protein
MTTKIHECIVDDLWGIEFEGGYFGTAHLGFAVGDALQVAWIDRAYNFVEVRHVGSTSKGDWRQAIYLGNDPAAYRTHYEAVKILYSLDFAA